MATGAGYSPGAEAGSDLNIDREAVCYRLTSTGDTVHVGTKRHDDRLPPPGFVVFDSAGNPVDTSADGYVETTCESCCPIVLGEGCWESGPNSGQWVSIQDPDGTIRVIDSATGATVDPSTFVSCSPGTQFVTTVRDVTNQTFTLTNPDLYSWAVRKRSGTVTLAANGGTAVTMDDFETIASESRDDGVLGTDSVVITATGAGSSARVVFVTRV